ncbi:MAG: hypothetical protein ACYTG6_06595 [Planctomycetota bacterium]|jgi:hypothetical protein
MRPRLFVLPVLLLAATLVACGDKPASDEERARDALEEAMDRGIPIGFDRTGSGLTTNPSSIELTDEMMEQYIAMMKEMKGVSDSDVPPVALLNRYGWDLQRYMTVSMKIAQATASGVRGSMNENLPEQLADMDQQIADLEQRIAEADATTKPMLESGLEMLRRRRSGLVEHVESLGTSSDLDRKNWEVLQRWLPRLEEAAEGD